MKQEAGKVYRSRRLLCVQCERTKRDEKGWRLKQQRKMNLEEKFFLWNLLAKGEVTRDGLCSSCLDPRWLKHVEEEGFFCNVTNRRRR